MARLVLLNALPLGALPWDVTLILCFRKSLDDLRGAVHDAVSLSVPVECYIRHESTVKALGIDKLTPSAGLYTAREGDEIWVVTLKKPARGREAEVSEEDLEVFQVLPAKGVWLHKEKEEKGCG